MTTFLRMITHDYACDYGLNPLLEPILPILRQILPRMRERKSKSHIYINIITRARIYLSVIIRKISNIGYLMRNHIRNNQFLCVRKEEV